MLKEFPDVRVENVDVRQHPEALLELGVRRYPALGHGERVLSKLFLTKRSIRKFLSAVTAV